MQTTDTKFSTIGIFCPTRKRPASLLSLIKSITENADRPDRVHFALYVDSDDEMTLGLIKELNEKTNLKITVVIEPHNSRPLSDTYNLLYKHCPVDIMMQFGDDTLMRTQGWDSIVENAFERHTDKIALVYGRDGIHNEGFAPHYALHKNWIETIGYVSPPYFTADWSDTWMFEIAKEIKRNVFLPDLLIEHLHWTQGKSQIDETTVLSEIRRKTHNNEALYRSESMKREREEAVAKLREKISKECK